MVTAVLFELVGVALAAVACSGAVAGVAVGRAKTRALARLEKTIPDVAPAPGPVDVSRGPFRTPGRESSSGDARPRRSRRGGRLFHHDYDLMIGRTFFR
ncbi:MAG: hypothetical protein KIS78_11270 [Labilithrix sp.]|nr:hypothetical protein [Labilithrix sp.]MCW5832980.1 hypothetical protein [Labilithrix sp.]